MVFVVIAISAAAALIEFFTKQRAAVYLPYGIINPLLFLLPRILYMKNKRLRNRVAANWVRTIEFLVGVVIILNAFGSLWWHSLGFQYDRFLHFSSAFLALPAAVLVLLAFGFNKKKPTLIFSFIIIVFGLFMFEGLQYLIDAAFGMNLFSDANQSIKVDFWEDIFFGVAGASLALYFIEKNFNFFINKINGEK